MEYGMGIGSLQNKHCRRHAGAADDGTPAGGGSIGGARDDAKLLHRYNNEPADKRAQKGQI
jgi:hypothetical protein